MPGASVKRFLPEERRRAYLCGGAEVPGRAYRRPDTMRAGQFILGRRGDGEYGENITPNLRTVRRLPLRIPVMSETQLTAPERLALRGEAYVDKADF